jgi:nitrogen fixation/metabolism regulation signal transduction histidine kinase
MSIDEPQRRSLLIDPAFQLKYTGMILAVVAIVMVALGIVVGRTTETAAHYANIAASQAEKAMKESRANSQLTRQNVLLGAGQNPDLVKMIEDELAQADRDAESELHTVEGYHDEIESRRRVVLGSLIGAGILLMLLLVPLGIYVTRRVVGPVHKIKRLLRRVGTGRLGVKERLRRGDELGDLFDTFMQMTYSLTALQAGRLATLDATMQKAEASGAAPEVLAGLRALRAQMVLGLRGTDVVRDMPS